ncbi:MAG: hypothetical protein OWP43_12795 [Sphaerochaetaceae bacterium]|nr:hypothetical protein [Sphaerochaetaceae bacterium]
MNNIIIDKFITENKNIALSLAPTYKIAFKDKSEIILSKLNDLGISIISETINGYYLIVDKVKDQLKESEYIISEACPIIKELIYKRYPNLKDKLDGCSSPLSCHCKKLKDNFDNISILFVGPCKHKKNEALKDKSADLCITFEELIEYLKYKDLLTEDVLKGDFCNFTLCQKNTTDEINMINIDGINNVVSFLNFLDSNPTDVHGYINLFYCKDGCLGRTVKLNNLSKYEF